MNRMKTSELMKRFAPYYFKYWKALLFDLFCDTVIDDPENYQICRAVSERNDGNRAVL